MKLWKPDHGRYRPKHVVFDGIIAEQNKKLRVSAYIDHHQVFTTSLLKSLIKFI